MYVYIYIYIYIHTSFAKTQRDASLDRRGSLCSNILFTHFHRHMLCQKAQPKATRLFGGPLPRAVQKVKVTVWCRGFFFFSGGG